MPFGTAVWYSLQRYNMNLPMLRGFIWFEQYVQLFQSGAFWNTVRVSLLYAVLHRRRRAAARPRHRAPAAPLDLAQQHALDRPAAAADGGAGDRVPDVEADDPSRISGSSATCSSLLGITDFRWASAPSSALFTVILVDVWVYTPFIMILLLAGLRSLPRQPFEAAELDGVPASFVFFRITLPMLMPYIITAALFRMLDSIQQFDIVYAMTQGGPGNATLLFQVQAYLDFFKNFNVGRSAAMLMVLWLIANLISNQFIKHWLRLRERARGGSA